MKQLKNFTVVLNDRQKRTMVKRVNSCVSRRAACQVAAILWGTEPMNHTRWWPSLAWEI